MVDVTDVANYLGGKYGGWYDVCRKYGTRQGKWIALPLGVIGNAIVYRDSHVKAAGFDGIPKDTAGFLKLCQAMKDKGTPAGFALGKAVGDGNNWAHWLLWSHGGKLVDDRGNVVVNRPETVAALEYARQLYETFIPGTLSWLDPSQQQGLPRRPDLADRQRHLGVLRGQELAGCQVEGNRGRHPARAFPDRAGRQADGAACRSRR